MTKQELINKYRDISVDHDWWECIEQDLYRELHKQGFELDKMYFSGFWPQGDGACFTGHMRDWKAYVDSNPEFAKAFPGFVECMLITDIYAHYNISHTDRYYHSNSITHTLDESIEFEARDFERVVEDDPDAATIEDHMVLVMLRRAAIEIKDEEVYTWLKEDFKGRMDALYRTLQQEYEYLTSDEAVWEMIEANGLDSELNEEDEDDSIPDVQIATEV